MRTASKKDSAERYPIEYKTIFAKLKNISECERLVLQ